MTGPIAHDEPVTIVGGGITGLSAASFLLLCGHAPDRITVLEGSDRWGGHARTLYLYKDASGAARMVARYDIDLQDPAVPRLRPTDPTPEFVAQFPDGAAPLPDPRILPTDAGFCIFTSEYRNYRRLLARQSSYPVIDTSMKSHIRRSYHLENDVFLESYLPLYGLWRKPLRFLLQIPQLIHLKRQLVRFIDSVEGGELSSMTADDLCTRSGIDGTIFGDLVTAMVSLYSGYTTAHLRRASARYFVDFLKITNMVRGFDGVTTSLFGNALGIHTQMEGLREAGVTLVANAGRDAIDPEGTTLFALHPWRVPALSDLRFDNVTVPVYVNTSEWGHLGADTHYRHTRESSHATHDIDRYRPDYPDFGVQITFGITGQDLAYEAKIRADASARGARVEIGSIQEYRGEPVADRPVKLTWEHAYVTPEFEHARREVWRRQGVDGRWYASASLLRSARHEDGVTSALDAVALMKGAGGLATLTDLGFAPSRPAADFARRP